MKRVATVVMGMATLSVLLVGCGKASQSASSSNSADLSGKVTAVGSTALQPLAAKAGADFTAKNTQVNLTVQGGGSGTGLSQVQAGAVAIGNSDIFAEQKPGVKASALTDHEVAVVGMGPVVNKDAGIKNISMANLKAIFTGKVTNWKQVGGKDQKIVIVNRAAGSGTRATFEAAVLAGKSAIKSQEQDSNGAVQKIVGSTPGAVSYLAFSYFTNKIQALAVDNITPTPKNVMDNKWKIWSYEHMYTKGKGNKATQAFLKYMMSKDVQNGLVKDMGYISVHDMQVSKDATGKVTAK